MTVENVSLHQTTENKTIEKMEILISTFHRNKIPREKNTAKKKKTFSCKHELGAHCLVSVGFLLILTDYPFITKVKSENATSKDT